MIPNPSLSLLGRKIVFSTIVQYAGKAVQLGLSVASLKLISNFLSQHDFGIYGTITEYALFFSVVANLGIFANMIRQMADHPRDGKIFISGLFLRMISAATIFIFGLAYLFLTGSDPVFLAAVALLLGSLFLDFITSVCDGMLQANYLMGRATLALIIGRLVNLGAVYVIITRIIPVAPAIPSTSTYATPALATASTAFAAASNTAPMVLLFAAAILGSMITAVISLYFVRAKIDWSWEIDLQLIKKIFWTSLPIGLVSTLNLLYFRFLPDYFATVHLSEEQFATFNISFRIAQVVSLLSTFLMFSALPGLREYIDQKHWQKVIRLLRKIGIFLLVSGTVLVIFGSLFGSIMIELLTHKKYFLPEFWFILPLMFLLAAISYGYDVILVSLFALEKDWWLVKMETVALAVALLFFGASFLFPSITVKVLLIIFGAIAGETVMLILGLLKMKRIFSNK